MEKWTGIISGTNRGLIVLDSDITGENKIVGNFQLNDAEGINISGKLQGNVNDSNITARLFDFTPAQEGVPTEGTVTLAISDDKKEMKGQWQTNVDTKGECILYKFSITEKPPIYKEPNLTLETKDISIRYCSFDKKSVEDIFKIMTDVANSIREGKGRDILPPIYSITYDKEERVRTYSLTDFFEKFNGASKIWYIGFEFKDTVELKNIYMNISYQQTLSPALRSNVLVESTNKEIVAMIPEMVRGLISKVRNKNSFWHHWVLGASIQLLAVIVTFALSFLVSKRLALRFPSQLGDIRVYIFIISFLVLSNLWTYFSRLAFNGIYATFPVTQITNKPKNRVTPVLIVAIIGSILAVAIIYCVSLLWELLF